MRYLSEIIKKDENFEALSSAVEGGKCPVLCTGTGRVNAANIISQCVLDFQLPVLIICPDENEAERLSADIEGFCGRRPDMLAAREMTFYSTEAVSKSSEQSRLETMYRIASAKGELVIAPAEALLQRSIPRDILLGCGRKIEMGGEYDLGEIVASLTAAGYERASQVEGTGQFALRGGILDFWSPAEPDAVRCEFFGDEVDSMGYFDVQSQRRTEVIDSAVIIPAAEVLPEAAGGNGAAGRKAAGAAEKACKTENAESGAGKNTARRY